MNGPPRETSDEAAVVRQIALGRTAEILALGDGRVLKLFLDGVDTTRIDAEEHDAKIAFARGATPIACHGRLTRDGRVGLLFDRLRGESLTRVTERNLLRLQESGRTLARAHAALHERSGSGFPDIRARTQAQLASPPLAFLEGDARARAEALVRALPDGDALLHMDFHTENVFAHDGTWAVIDWQTTASGAPAADVAQTAFLLAEAELFPGTPWIKRVLYGAVRRVLRDAYLREYRALTGVSAEAIAAWRLPALVGRLAGWDIEGEREQLHRAILEELER